jgi:hypothetical protein
MSRGAAQRCDLARFVVAAHFPNLNANRVHGVGFDLRAAIF